MQPSLYLTKARNYSRLRRFVVNVWCSYQVLLKFLEMMQSKQSSWWFKIYLLALNQVQRHKIKLKFKHLYSSSNKKKQKKTQVSKSLLRSRNNSSKKRLNLGHCYKN